MAVAFDRKLGEVVDSAAGVTIVLSSVTVSAGEYVVIWACSDNAAGTNLPTVFDVRFGATSQTFSVVASHGSSSTTADAATRGFIIVVPSATAISSGSITVEFSNSVSKCLMLAAVFTGATSTTNTAGSTTSINTVVTSTGGGSNGLSLGLISYENNAAWAGSGFTNGGGYTAPGGDGSVFSTGGGATANLVMQCGYLIVSGSNGVGFTPTGMSNDGGACVVTLEAASTGTPISGSDTGSGADAKSVLTAAVPGTETATGVDAKSVLTATLSTAGDTGSAVESGSVVVTVFVSGSDTGSAVESGAVTVPITGADTATGVDARLTLTVTTTGTDTGSGADSGSTTASLTGADTGSATESGSVQVGIVNVSGTDTGAALDAGNVVASLSRTDTGSAVESGVVTTAPVTITASETISSVEDVSIVSTFYVLVLPVVTEFTIPPRHAVDRVGIPLALTLYRVGGTWFAGRNIRASVLAQADLVYRGGYEHVIGDEAIRAELVAAGYGFETREVVVA